jgi:two-component system nitrogen regulation sensor histidine kinase NtrY
VATAKPLSSASRPATRPAATAPARRPFRDNPPLILGGIAILIAALGGIVWVADRTTSLSPDFLTEVVLIALSATNVTMLLALVFVLARNVIKSMVEGRRGLPFGRFRAKLVLAMLGMTVIPSVLVLIVGSRVVLTAVDRWFNAPMEEILAGANSIAADYYQERQRFVADQAVRLSRSLGRLDLAAGNVANVQGVVTPEVAGQRIGMVQVYRVERIVNQPINVVSVVDIASPSMPQGWARGTADRLAARAASGNEASPSMIEQLASGGDLVHVATPVRGPTGQITGAVVASEYLSGQFAEQARRMS